MARKQPIPEQVRRDVAARYGCSIGGRVLARCAYCLGNGEIEWFAPCHRPGKGRVALLGLEFDHVIPESLGGLSVESNLVLACRPCNRSKGAKPAEGFGK